MWEGSIGVSCERAVILNSPNADWIIRPTNRKTNSSRHWMPLFWTTQTPKRGRPTRLSPRPLDQVTFHGAAGASFAPPGRLLIQDLNLRPSTSRHPPPWLNAWFSSYEKRFVVHETNSVSRGLTKESLRPFPISQTAARTSRPTNTPFNLKSRKQSRNSFPHTQTSPPFSSTITSGRQVQPNHDATETPLRNCSLERISKQVTSRG